MPTITIIGPGAIGGTVAAWLAQDGANSVSICARTPFEELKVDTPVGSLLVVPQLFTSPDQVAKPSDWVMVATKAYDVAGAVSWFPGLIAPHTRVAILQNGVEHIERFAPYVNANLLIPVVLDLPAERSAPGYIRQKSNGHLVAPDNDNGRDFVRLFTHIALTATTTADFRSRAWRKLALNCTGAVSALLLRSIDIRQNEEIADLMRVLIRECIIVGRAEGAQLDDALEEEIIGGYRKHPLQGINSIHADRLAGRQLEIDARNGAVVRIGEKHGIDTPMNRLIVTLLKAAGSVS
jgi:2-dehydropantoate 2-reductase